MSTGTLWGAFGARAAENTVVAPPGRLRFVQMLGEMVIPATDTAGASSSQIAEFVILAADRGMNGAAPDTLARLEARLDELAGTKFVDIGEGARQAVLERVDLESFPAGTDAAATPWALFKGLLMAGYYRSEIGGSQELRYDLVPGRFDPDLPADQATRAMSSDWTGVNYP
jgi:hypothetical protein